MQFVLLCLVGAEMFCPVPFCSVCYVLFLLQGFCLFQMVLFSYLSLMIKEDTVQQSTIAVNPSIVF